MTEWPDTQDANRPNAGWEYLKNDEKAMKVREGYFGVAPVGCFLDWGYCIWDRSRLEAWWLVVPEKKTYRLTKKCWKGGPMVKANVAIASIVSDPSWMLAHRHPRRARRGLLEICDS